MPENHQLRVLALIYPIERHVGHWACSSQLIQVRRVIMDGDDLTSVVAAQVREFQPDAIAIIGKRVGEYHDLLDRLSRDLPLVKQLPRIYRCQNTALAHRVAGRTADRDELARLDHWFAFASDPRFSLILVQTLDDVPIIQHALDPKRVVACPYGYDPTIFHPDLPNRERTTDVGCYMTLRNDPRRIQLVKTAQRICDRRGWSFQFVTDKYWHDYADLIRATKVCLHRSDQGEVPYRIYETTCLGSVFLTDPLRYHIETLFELGDEYLTYNPDLSNLESVLVSVLEDSARWQALSRKGRERARYYSWPCIADRYVAPALRELLPSQRSYA